MFNKKNLSVSLLSIGLLSLSITYANAATDVTPLFSVYEEACGYIESNKSKNGEKTYDAFKSSFITHKKSTKNGTIFSLKKNYVLPEPYKNAVSSITMKKGDKYSSNSVTYTVKFKDATYRKKPISHLEIYLVPDSGDFYDALHFKTSITDLKNHFKKTKFYSNEEEDYVTSGADLDYAKKTVTCYGLSGSYK